MRKGEIMFDKRMTEKFNIYRLRRMLKKKQATGLIWDKFPIKDRIKILEANMKYLRAIANAISRQVRILKDEGD
nr:MAG: hypothetical protein [uncultured archaeon]